MCSLGPNEGTEDEEEDEKERGAVMSPGSLTTEAGRGRRW